ncbi:hypothetical protein U1Q18_026630 [Sarracenia purpurea var. burkii]
MPHEMMTSQAPLGTSSPAHTATPSPLGTPSGTPFGTHSAASNATSLSSSPASHSFCSSSLFSPSLVNPSSVLGPPSRSYPCTPHCHTPPPISLYIPIIPCPLSNNSHPILTRSKSRTSPPTAFLATASSPVPRSSKFLSADSLHSLRSLNSGLVHAIVIAPQFISVPISATS